MLPAYLRTHMPRLLKTSGVLLVISLAMVLLPRYFASGTAATGICDVPPAQIAPLDTEEAKFLQLINAYRAASGAGPLTISYTLSQSAQWKSNDMAANNYYDHPDLLLFRSVKERFFDCGYAYDGIDYGENITGVDDGTAAGALTSWQGSDSHNATMLDPNLHVIGIGRTYTRNFAGTGATSWLWTTDFGEYNDGASYRPPLPNDNFANATQVATLPFTDGPMATFDTAVISTEQGESGGPVLSYWGGGNCYMGRTVWYKITPSTNMTIQADTKSSDFDTVLAVYTGSSLGNLNLVDCSDNAYGYYLQSMVQFQATAGTTYYIQAGKRWVNNIYWNLLGTGSMNDYLKVNISCVSCSAGTPTSTTSPLPTTPPASPSPTASPTLTPTPTASPTDSPTASPTDSPTASPTPTPTPEPAPAPAIDPVVDPPITQPADGAIVPAGKTITIAATANGTNGITKVEFYVNGVRKCSDSAAPYTCNWGVPTAKGVVYTLTAKAYDPQGNTAQESITVTSGHDSLPPSVSLTNPATGSTVAAGKVVSVAAAAADEVGVTKVEFYVNGVRKCSDKLAPYVCNWTVPNGAGVTYTLVARAYDAQGNATYSPAVTVTSR